ncbi:MAG: hypothetical protein O4965_09250 [Trichodesmium sp. St19_bin1]|nr:hypothetical protein [Trichodesmium sp. St19_bin1]
MHATSLLWSTNMKNAVIRTYAKKPGFDSKSLFLTHKYLRETGFAEFAFVSPEIV